MLNIKKEKRSADDGKCKRQTAEKISDKGIFGKWLAYRKWGEKVW